MDLQKKIAILEKYDKFIEEKKEQTDYKIQYVTKYVENWIRVLSNATFCDNLNFIDCMCNAGLYKDGDLCTATVVLKMFKKYANIYPHKTYSLYVNDKSKERLESFTEIADLILDSNVPANIKLYLNNEDVNEYLKILEVNDHLFNFPSATILYVDPYDFGTVHIPTLKSFAQKYYCEIIFNVFTSDFVRNGIDQRIKNVIDDETVTIRDKEELINYIISQLKVNKMKYSFQYAFRISTNVELYQIMFLTPNDKGLDELKNALWDTFKGEAFHRNGSRREDEGQISMFTENDDVDLRLKQYAHDAKEHLKENYKGKILSFEEICNIILPISMLKSGHIVNALIKPAIESGEIEKLNQIKPKSNFKRDSYKIN